MKTILLIEDTPTILENLTEYLEMEGYRILTANNGRKGIEVAAEFMPDLIICDVRMPEMDGHEVLQSLIDTPKTSEIPFIFSTSLSEKIDRSEAIALGADDYITKPFEMEPLLKMIDRLMQTGSKRRKMASL